MQVETQSNNIKQESIHYEFYFSYILLLGQAKLSMASGDAISCIWGGSLANTCLEPAQSIRCGGEGLPWRQWQLPVLPVDRWHRWDPLHLRCEQLRCTPLLSWRSGMPKRVTIKITT